MDAPFDLNRFLEAQKYDYEKALSEIRAGRKTSHWMWYIFPQHRDLGRSYTAQYYGISNLDQARAYLAHPVLGTRLRQISEAMLHQPDDNAERVLGWIDSKKLCSSMTLFAMATEDNGIFLQVLDRFYQGRQDPLTLGLLLGEGEGKP